MKKTAIVIPDIHFPLHSQSALNVVKKAIPIVKPDIAILLGDVAEMETVSSWKYKKKKRPNMENWTPKIDHEVADANVLLTMLDGWFDDAGVQEKYYCEGNHEVWLDNFVEEHPYLPDYSPEIAFKLEERKYKYFEYGQYLKIGQLFFYHGGHYGGKYHCFHHVLNLGANVMYAHHHGVARESCASMNGVHSAFCIGSLKLDDAENNKWLKGRRVNWSHAFAIVHFQEDGTFRAEIVDITDGVTVLNGQTIDGN